MQLKQNPSSRSSFEGHEERHCEALLAIPARSRGVMWQSVKKLSTSKTMELFHVIFSLIVHLQENPLFNVFISSYLSCKQKTGQPRPKKVYKNDWNTAGVNLPHSSAVNKHASPSHHPLWNGACWWKNGKWHSLDKYSSLTKWHTCIRYRRKHNVPLRLQPILRCSHRGPIITLRSLDKLTAGGGLTVFTRPSDRVWGAVPSPREM